MTMLSPRFDEALSYASRLHRGQIRKGTTIPYVAHLLGVASIALEHGASEDEAIGALLHDALEDQSRNGATELEIRHQFGDRVFAIVRGCTDAEGEAGKEKPPWRERKEAYIDHIAKADASTRLVSASDKLHNAHAILADLRTHGEALWPRFTGGRDGSLWYYRGLVTAFGKAGGTDAMVCLVAELERTVSEIERLGRPNASGA
jgi:(p)ppGpp synthase/HD superfamily hydrolase